jgi:hypothetical protein
MAGPPIGLIPTTPTPTPPGAAPTTPTADQAKAALASQGIRMPDAVLDADQILQAWADAGIDTSDPQVQQNAEFVAAVYQQTGSEQGQMIYSATGQKMLQEHPAEISTYSQIVQKYNLEDVVFPQKYTIRAMGEVQAPTHAGQYVQKGDAVIFRNGAVAFPETGQVVYPLDGSVPGSRTWVSTAEKTWSEEQTLAWRQQLYQLGYSVTKKGGWDQPLIDATLEYYKQKYLNLGEVVPTGMGAGGASPTSQPVNPHRFVGAVQGEIFNQFRSVYGQDPSPDELQSWTQFVMRMSKKLQRGPLAQRMSIGGAVSEAEARMGVKLYQSPEASFLRNRQEENTSLHDALTTAIQATRGL